MVNRLTFEQDMNKEVRVRQISGSLFEYDNAGTELRVKVTRNGIAESLTGSIVCEFLRADGSLVVQNGSRSGNEAWAVVPSAAMMPGMIKILMRNVNGSEKTTLLAISGVVVVSDGSAYIDPGSVIPSLADFTALVTRAETAAGKIEAFSISATQISGTRYRVNIS